MGHEVVVTREPGGTELGEILRDLVTSTKFQSPTPKAEALLYQAIRAQHVDLVIRPALEQKKWVLCDRFRASSIAFQGGARGLKREEIEWLNDFSTSKLKEDLTILLDLSVEESLKRLHRRYENSGDTLDRFEQEKQDFHERVRSSYLEQAKSGHWLVLNSAEPPLKLKELALKSLREQKWLD